MATRSLCTAGRLCQYRAQINKHHPCRAGVRTRGSKPVLAAQQAGQASESARAALLRVTGVTVRFGGIVALDRVSFDVEDGQVCGLIGPNGAGKTTLFNCLSRLYPFQEGSILFEGRSLVEVPRHGIAEPGDRTHIPEPRAVPHAHACRRTSCSAPTRRTRGGIPRLFAALAGCSPRGAGDGGARRRADGAGRTDRVRAAPRRRSALRRAEAGRAGARRSPAVRACCCWTSPRPASTTAKWRG